LSIVSVVAQICPIGARPTNRAIGDVTGLVAPHLVVMRPPFSLTLLTAVGRIYELAIPLRPNQRLVIVIISGYDFRKSGNPYADPPKEISI
jgi:hypothetical protein